MNTRWNIVQHDFTDDVKADVKSLFEHHDKTRTFEHTKAVAEVNIKIAAQYDLDKDICEICGYLHDISAVVSPNDMLTYDMALFVADKLAWDQEGEAPFYEVVYDALKQSLEKASLAYMDYIVENKMILFPHKWFEESRVFLRGIN